jgi:hypothetical protein
VPIMPPLCNCIRHSSRLFRFQMTELTLLYIFLLVEDGGMTR